MLESETVLLAESHLTLRKANQPNLPFAKAYSYGKSTKNQRIEAWWNILTEGQTQEWKVFFVKLESDRYLDCGDTDKSCLQYHYMDIMRSHIDRFIKIHNSHPILFLRNREHYLPTGQSFLMYYYPENAKDFKEKVDKSLLTALENVVAGYHLNEYLPESTLKLYGQFLEEGGYPKEFAYSDPLHKNAYLYLRERVSEYILLGGEVQLASRPAGAAEWIAAKSNHEIEVHPGNVHGVLGDACMQLLPTDDEMENDILLRTDDVTLPEEEMEDALIGTNNSFAIHVNSGSYRK